MCNDRPDARPLPGLPIVAAPPPRARPPRRRAEISLRGLLTAAGALAVAASLAGHLGDLAWPLELASHFRAQYLGALVAVSAGLLAARRWRAAGVFAALSVPDLLAVGALWTGGAGASEPTTRPVRVLCHNVHRVNEAHDAVREAIENEDPDVVVLLEVNDRWLRELEPLRARYPHEILRPRPDNFGMAVLSRLEIGTSGVDELARVPVPTIVAELRDGERSFTLVATHPVPPVGAALARARDAQLDALARLTRSIAGAVVVAGDLNCTPFSPRFERLLGRSGLRDSTRGFGLQPTWPAGFAPLWIPIDHCLVSDGVRVADRRLGPAAGSDHRSLIVELVVGR